MSIRFDGAMDAYVIESDYCVDCEQPLYFSACEAPGCSGNGCQDCGTGCDLDFAEADLSRCARAIAAEGESVRDTRLTKERAAFGLGPIPADPTEDDDAEHLNHGKGK